MESPKTTGSKQLGKSPRKSLALLRQGFSLFLKGCFMKRLLVTGSRNWDNVTTIKLALNHAVNYLGDQVTLVHGACPTGADDIADDLFTYANLGPVEAHPADWNTHGNSLMVDLGADLCLAFIKNESRGATMTANLAEKAGIRTWRYTE